MPLRLLMILLAISTVPAFAQQNVSNISSTFALQKGKIDSLAQVADTIRYIEHAAFNGRARVGRYRVECFYNKPSKEILKANYLIVTDSANYNKIYYFRGNTIIKINDNNTAMYYQVGDQLYNEYGGTANPAVLKSLMSVIADTWQGLYAALFQ